MTVVATVVCLLLATVVVGGCNGQSTEVTSSSEADAETTASHSALLTLTDRAGVEFVDVAADLGISYRWPQQPRPMHALQTIGCGCALFDFDADGWLDVLLVADPHPILYRNLKGERFDDITAGSGLTFSHGDWIGCAVGDYDADGWLDLLLTGFHRLALFRNEQGRSFKETTVPAGLDPQNNEHWATGAGFMDLDGDGFLDLVLLNYVVFGPESKQYCELTNGVLSGCPPTVYEPQFAEIWKNNGGGGFEFVSPEASGMSATHGICLVLAFTDFDDDGRIDFYIGNDGTPAELMHNLGDMRFENLGVLSGLSVGREQKPMAAMGADWGDFNRDGLLDLTVTDFQKNSFCLFRNDGRGFFLEVGNTTGISSVTRQRLGFGAKWLDMENDGWPDICFVNGHVYDNVGQMDSSGAEFRQPIMLFRNLAGTRFVDLVPILDRAVRRPLVGRGSATGDFNRDGRTDVLIVDYEGPAVLLQNLSCTEHHWITLELRGAAPNLHAYGAKITARAGGALWVGQVSPANSYLSSSSAEIHWGLGDSDRLDMLTIRWPSGNEQSFENVAVDRFLRISEESTPDSTPPSN